MTHVVSPFPLHYHSMLAPAYYSCPPPHLPDNLKHSLSYKQTTGGYTEAQWKDFQSKEKYTSQFSKEGRKLASRPRIGRRQWKEKRTVHKMVLGLDVGLAETCSLMMCGLVGRLSYIYLCKVALLEWVHSTWRPLLGYKPKIVFLTKGWFDILCKSPEDMTLLLEHKWVLGRNSLMLKHWSLAFNPDTEYFQL
jgi:hypothetical protein